MKPMFLQDAAVQGSQLYQQSEKYIFQCELLIDLACVPFCIGVSICLHVSTHFVCILTVNTHFISFGRLKKQSQLLSTGGSSSLSSANYQKFSFQIGHILFKVTHNNVQQQYPKCQTYDVYQVLSSDSLLSAQLTSGPTHKSLDQRLRCFQDSHVTSQQSCFSNFSHLNLVQADSQSSGVCLGFFLRWPFESW